MSKCLSETIQIRRFEGDVFTAVPVQDTILRRVPEKGPGKRSYEGSFG